jgi:hypothetical protein
MARIVANLSSWLLLLLLLLVVVVSTAAATKEQEDEPEEAEEAAVVVAPLVHSIQDDLSYDENNKLRSHYLVYPAFASDDCEPVTFDGTSGPFEVRGLTGKALYDVFGSSVAPTDCRAACIERGTDKAVAHAVMPHKFYNSETDDKDAEDDTPQKDFYDWFENTCSNVETCLMNYYDTEHFIQTFWFPLDGSAKQEHIKIEYGNQNTRCFKTWIGHKFQVTDHTGTVVIDEFTIDFALVKGFGESPPSDTVDARDFDQEIMESLDSEWSRHNRVTRTFSPLGFAKGRLPPDVFASMGAFFYNNRFNKVREEWQDRGVFVNWWETDVFFIQIPWELKQFWQIRLLALVEAWAGVPVEQTVMYGLRQYETGARLLTHVDRISTHAVSLIVNVAQGNLTEPWPVEVHDHADRLHEVIMEPGDVVFYESAKNLHGRNRPMKGKNAYYTNLFTHYRPTGDDRWYEKPNHEGAPEAVGEAVVGECRLKQVGVAETPTHTLGMVEAVVCDDPRLGSYISPTLFKAKNEFDLMDWWRRTSPEKDAAQCEQ